MRNQRQVKNAPPDMIWLNVGFDEDGNFMVVGSSVALRPPSDNDPATIWGQYILDKAVPDDVLADIAAGNLTKTMISPDKPS